MQPIKDVTEDELLASDGDTDSDVVLVSDSSSEDDDDEDEEEGDDDNNTFSQEAMVLGFVAVTPDDSDLKGIEMLCKQLFKYFPVDVKQLAELIVEQNYVTSALKEEVTGDIENAGDDTDADNTVYGVYSAVNLKAKKDRAVVKQILEFILTQAAKTVDGDIFKEVLNVGAGGNPHTPGLLIKEKIVNVPGVAAAPLMKQLLNDLDDAVENEMQYNFTHYIHFAKLIRMKNQDDYFVDQDDEIVHQHNTRYIDVKYDSSIDSTVVFQNDVGKTIKGKSFRRIYLITKSEMTDVMNELESLEQVQGVMQQAGSSGLQI